MGINHIPEQAAADPNSYTGIVPAKPAGKIRSARKKQHI